MRIIAGLYKGRKLISPKGNELRPTPDMVKEAVFSLLIPHIGEDCIVMDAFAGSGSLGLEALSRGASTVYFSESSRENLAIIKENIKLCGAEENTIILSGDFKNNIRRIRTKVNIFLLDPPYGDGQLSEALRIITESGKLAEEGVIVCEHRYRDRMPEEIHGLTMIKDRRYGKTGITIYMRSEEAREGSKGKK